MLTTPAIITAAEYLAAERKSPERNEFFNGEIIPMTGASRPHNLIANKISRLLGNVLDELDYEVYQSDMRVHNPVSESYSYPDVVVVKGAPQLIVDEFDTLLNPVLIIEVLSPGTESYDRGDKALAYRQIPSLREYVLISQDKPVVEHWVRLAENKWQVEDIEGLDATLRLLDGTCEIKLADVHRKVLPR
jgi:Uma2 family endonuclease